MMGRTLAEFERRKVMAEKCFGSFKLVPKTFVRPPVTEILMRTHVDLAHGFRCNTLLAWKDLPNSSLGSSTTRSWWSRRRRRSSHCSS